MIIIFTAHPDDEVLGMGGTLAKFGNKAKTFIFTYGDKYPPKKGIKEIRIKEVNKAHEILGTPKPEFLGFHDMEIDEKKAEKKVRNIIEKYKPEKVFYMSNIEGHPDHLKVNKICRKVLKDYPEIEKYEYTVTSFLDLFSKRPKIIIDITNTFEKKIEALRAFESQRGLLSFFIPLIHLRAKIAGWEGGYKYGEHFFIH